MPVCATCGEEHEEVEPGFRRPDAWFAVPEPERAKRIDESNDLVCIDGEAHFIRCVAPIPVRGREEPYAWGFWVKVSKHHFEEYRRYYSEDPPAEHAGFPGTLANQTRWLPPTLGLRVHVHLGRGSARPHLLLLDERHALTQQQTKGVTSATAHAWSDAISDRHLPPVTAPRAPTLEEHGWLIARPEQVGRTVHELARPPRPRDLVKVPFVLRAADPRGEVCERVELMWVLIDAVDAHGWWSGTLDNRPFVPAPVDAGSPVWVRAEHVLAFEPGDEA